MQGTIRLIIILFIFALIVHSYASNRILNLSIRTLDQDFDKRTQLVAHDVSAELNGSSLERPDVETYLQQLIKRHDLMGIAIYNHRFEPEKMIVPDLPDNLKQVLEEPQSFLQKQSPIRWEKHLLQSGTFTSSNQIKYAVLVFDAERIFRVERSTTMIGLLNWLMIGFVAIFGFYLIESTLRPIRVLLQTARSVPPETTAGRPRNDAEFLIGTFDGVITRLKAKEQELGKLHLAEKARADDVQQLNQDLLRSITSGLLMIDQSNRIRVLNEAAGAILRVGPAAALYQPYSSLLQKVSPVFKEDVDRCFAEQLNINRAELEIKTENGELRYLNSNIMPLRDRQQNFAGVVCIFSDITEFKLLQQHMILKEKFASLGEMAAGVAHEFRNSLATITGYLQLLETKIDQKSYLNPIHKELDLLQKVVNDFLSFARPAKPQLTTVALGELIKECVEEARIAWQARSIDFSISGAFPEICGDEAMLRQVFTNLIRNAAEAINGNSREGCVQIHGSLNEMTKTSTIEVRDNGIGIRESDLPRIFSPFFSTKENGVGLGLAIVQKLVLQHNGSITAESTEEGTTFRIYLPDQLSTNDIGVN